MHFENKVIWITGASSGIGAELARQLAAQKARLILTSRNTQALNEVKSECRKTNTACTLLPPDITQSIEIEPLCQQALNIYGRIDVVIHSAGVTQRSLATETSMEVYRRLMEVNFFAPAGITKALLQQQPAPFQVVVLSSMAGLMGFPLRTGYAAAKHALHGFFETLQTESSTNKLDITIVSPGRIRTPISLSALTGSGKAHGQMDKGQVNGIPVEQCAQKIINAMARKKRHIIIAREECILYWLWWFARPLYYKIAAKKGLEAYP